MRIFISVAVALVFSNVAAGQWKTMVKDTFSDQRPLHYDLSTKLLWGGQISPASAFKTDTLVADDFGLAFNAIGVLPKATANANYQLVYGLKTSIAIDYPLPTFINREVDSIRVSFDMLWDTLVGTGEAGRIVAGLMHNYPAGGPVFGSVDSLNGGHPFGRPAYNIRIMNKNAARNNNLNGVMMHGGGHTRLGDFEIYRSGTNKWWLPGFSTEPGGTSPGSSGVFPNGGCAQVRNNPIASTTKWRRFTWSVYPEKMILEARNASDPESSNLLVMQMFIPKVDTTNFGPTVASFNTFYGTNLTLLPRLYFWYPKIEAFRFFWNAGSNVWMANLNIESTNHTQTASKTEQQNISSIRFFPNPGHSKLTIENIKPGTHIAVFDVLGRQVFQSNSSGDFTEISSSEWANGVYRVFVKSSGQTKYINWVKN